MPLGLWLVGGCFLLWPLSAFLPEGEGQWPDWRRRVVEILGENLMGGMRTPQPWVTLEAWLMMVGVAAWVVWCVGQDWPWSRLRGLVILLLIGTSILVTLAWVGYFTGVYVGVWEQRTEHAKVFGFFQNRNQTGTVLALTALLVGALIDMDLRHRKLRVLAPLWALFYVPLLGGMFLTGSRMGVLVFFVGMLGWFVIRQIQRRRRWNIGVVFMSLFLVLGAGFMVFGGRAFYRLHALVMGGGDLLEKDLRFSIFQNIMRIGGEFAIWGVGLGQFPSVFAQYQDFALTSYARLLHPESSWLWVFVEMGAVAVMVLAGMVLFYVLKSFPVRVGEGLALRVAAYVGCVLFFINMGFDVPGHRVGAVMLLGLMLGMSVRNKEWGVIGRWFSYMGRGIGLGVMGLGVVFLLSSSGVVAMPTSAEAERLNDLVMRYVKNEEMKVAREVVDDWLGIQPLNARALFIRGQLCAVMEDWDGAQSNFKVARMLEPFSPGRARVEALIWLDQNPVLAVEAWRDILERGDPGRRANYFGELFGLMRPKGEDGLRYLRWLARRQVDVYLRYLMLLSAKDFNEEVRAELESPEWIISLDTRQRDQLLLYWARVGNAEELHRLFTEYSDWKELHRLAYGWMLYRLGRFEEAYNVLVAVIERPTLPAVRLPTDRESVRKAYYRQSEHFHVIYQYILLLKEERNFEELIRTVERARRLENSPSYLIYLHAVYLAELGNWEGACKEILNYYQAASSVKR
jgi:tetratricopeptide (TPR) repeat protein